MTQTVLFAPDESVKNLPAGMSYCSQLIAEADEKALIARVRDLPFKEFEFHGFKGKRRTVSFGWHYEFSGHGRLQKATEIPEFILPLRATAARFAKIDPESFQHVLIIEYGPGAGIGWHRDKSVFGEVIGVSLLAPCMLRFRRKLSAKDSRDFGGNSSDEISTSVLDPGGKSNIGTNRIFARKRDAWQRVNLLTEPRSAYHLTGPARQEWQHSILSVPALRYSITFRTLSVDK